MIDAGKRLIAKVALAVERWAHGVYDTCRVLTDDELLEKLNEQMEAHNNACLLCLDIANSEINFVSDQHAFDGRHDRVLLAAIKKIQSAVIDAERAERNNEDGNDE